MLNSGESCINTQHKRIMKSMLWDICYSIKLNSYQLTQFNQAEICCKIRGQFKQSREGNPPWSIEAFVRTVCEIELHDVVCSGVLAIEF
jgi:hypothetical protein